MTITDEPAAGQLSLGELYAEVQLFYARHMYLLDSGQADEWAEGFTREGVFAPPSAQPVRGRTALAAAARAARAELAAAREQHRHLLLCLDLESSPDGTLSARSYAQIVATPVGGSPRLHLMCVTYDVLVREEGSLRIQHRRVTRDDRPS